jgi:hypothetical protein
MGALSKLPDEVNLSSIWGNIDYVLIFFNALRWMITKEKLCIVGSIRSGGFHLTLIICPDKSLGKAHFS